MKKQLLIASLALTTSIGYAQQPNPSVAATLPAPKVRTHDDSVQAVRTIFQKHRTGGWIWTAIGSAFAVRIVSVAASSSASDGFSSTPGGTVVGVALLGGMPAGIGIGKLARFSKSKEEQIVELYNKSNILPPYVKRRLKPKSFAR